jgi:acyl-CoA synthetase (AMP-forming)/AMP-acid ligase II
MSIEPSAVTKQLDGVIEARPDAPAYHFRNTTMTFGELGQGIRHCAGGLATLGIDSGERVGVMLRNRPEFFVLSQAIWRAGGVMVPVNVLLSAFEATHVVRDSGMRVLVVNGDLAERAREAVAAAGADVTIVVADAEMAQDGELSWDDLLARGTDDFAPRPPREDRLAVIAYTSGTTGVAKGAMLQDFHLHEWMVNAAEHLDLTETDHFLQVFPVHSVAPGIIGGWLTATLGSACVIVERFDVAEIARVIEKYRVTCFAMVTTMLFDLLRHEFPEPPDFSSMRYIQGGGAAIPDRIRTELQDRWGIPLIKSYGSTEANYVSLDYPGVEAKPGSSGQVMPHLVVTIQDPDGSVLPLGESGEICVGPNPDHPRPFQPILGYWNDSEQTAEALAGGVFHTGDIGYVDEDGFVYCVDRLKDMLIRGGNNIYPAELEAAMQADPRVDAAYVVGVRDERLGDMPKAYVVLTGDAEAVSPDELLANANERLARYKRIEEVEIVTSDELPRNAMDKVLRRELARRANDATGAGV